jgi:hypothetical protein
VQAADSSIIAAQLEGLAAAVAATLLVLVLGARPWRRDGRTPAWCSPLALGLAVAAAFAATRGLPTLPPGETLHWLFYLALVAAAFGVYEASSGARPALARGLLSALLPLVLLAFQRRNHWGRLEGILWTAGLAASVFLVWHALLGHARRAPGGAAVLGWALATALAAGTYGLAGGGLFFLLPAALALATGACALLGLWRAEPGLGQGGLAPFALLHFAFLWSARYLYELSTLGFVLLSLAPLGVWLSAIAPEERPRLRGALACAGPTLLAAAALVHELAAAPAPYG